VEASAEILGYLCRFLPFSVRKKRTKKMRFLILREHCGKSFVNEISLEYSREKFARDRYLKKFAPG
jgi:hypothetical protein